MEEQKQKNETQEERHQEEQECYEDYGWEFHKIPLIFALILTILFYVFITLYINL